MAFVIKTAKTVRNNWKKSTFFAVVLAWGTSYTKNHFDTQNLMRAYCERATHYGNQTIAVTSSPKSITIILNPNANKRKAQAEFDKYCAPLLHLAGISIELIKTESEGHAKDLVDGIKEAEAVVVAGGDGTLSEVITGLLRRTNETVNGQVPLGVLPLGKHNTVAQTLFPGKSKLERVKSLADATMAVVEEATKPLDVLRIEILQEEEKKPVYAVSGIKWGAYRDAEIKKESYWYFGGLKKYATYVFNGLKSSLSWNCQAELTFSLPCSGCSNCYKVQNTQPKSKWFQSFVKDQNENLKYQHIINPHCSETIEKNISTTDFTLSTSNVHDSNAGNTEVPKISLYLGPQHVDYLDFVKQGWNYENNGTRQIVESIEVRTVQINPKNVTGKEIWFSIDNEDYEAKPIKVTLLPKLLKLYCKKESVDQ